MSLLQFPLIRLLLCLILGIVLGYYHPIAIDLLYSLIAVFLILCILLLWINKESVIYAFATTYFLYMFAIILGHYIIIQKSVTRNPFHYWKVVSDTPKQFQLEINRNLGSTEYYHRYIAKIHVIDSTSVQGKILLKQPIQDTVLKAGTLLWSFGMLKKLKPALNPNQFDYRKYLQKKEVYVSHTLEKGKYKKIKSVVKSIFYTASEVRSKILEQFKKQNISPATLGIMGAMFLGDKNYITNTTYEDYKNTGMLHILAISGLHIGLFVIILGWLFRPILLVKHGKYYQFFLILISLWFFVVVTGLSPSAIRAAIMFSFWQYGKFLDTPTNTTNIMTLAMLLMLCYEPLWLFDIGFQFSYAAVFSIIWFYPKLNSLGNPKHKVLKKYKEIFDLSIAAQLGIFPLALYYFHQFPGLFVISNLVVIPSLSILMPLGLMISFFAYINFTPKVLFVVFEFFISKINAVIHWLANKDAFVFTNIYFEEIHLFLYYALIVLFYRVCQKINFQRMAHFTLGLMGLIGFYQIQKKQNENVESLAVLHQYKKTILCHKNGSTLHIYPKQDSITNPFLEQIFTGFYYKKKKYYPLKDVYQYKNRTLIIVDEMGCYPKTTTHKTPTVLLIQSPKINIERLINILHPKQIIADGSNIPYLISYWKKISQQKGIPFHYTGVDGAYIFEE